jgi:hypothetical protein
MSQIIQPFAFELELPWQENIEREKAFKKIVLRVMVPVIILFLLVPFLKVVKIDRPDFMKPRIETKIVLEPLVAKKPVVKPVVVEEAPAVVEVPKEIPKVVEKAVAKVTPKKDEPVKLGTPGAAPGDRKAAVAATQGLSELSSQLKSLRSSIDIAKMQNKNVSENVGGSVAKSEREVLGGENAVKKSNGIVVSDAVMKGNGAGLADHQSTVIGGNGIGGTGGGGGDVNGVPNGQYSHLSGQAGKRDMESIRRTLEQTKSNVYTLYQRALLSNPDVAGKFTFKIVIEPNGSISDLKLVASELGLPDLEKSILAKIQQVNFGAKEVSATVIEYKFVFLPS